LPSHVAHRVTQSADLRFLSQAPALHSDTADTVLMHYVVCLFTPQLSLVLIASNHRGMARLS